MKLPRWLVIVMLTSSVLLPSAAAGWWWVTWPERTAREFGQLMAAEKWAEALRMMVLVHDQDPGTVPARELMDQSAWDRANIEPEPRTFRDIREARQVFRLAGSWEMTVERDRVRMVAMEKLLIESVGRAEYSKGP